MSGRHFRLITLGRLALRAPEAADDHPLTKRRRKLAVLTVLALARRPLPREQVVEMFWGDQAEARARHSLSDALWELRRALGPDAIVAAGDELQLAESVPLTLDAVELASAVAARDWAWAVALHAGPFLDGVHVSDSPRFDAWVTRERERLGSLFARACHERCTALARARQWEECETVASRWLDAEPTSPDAALFLLNAQKAPGTLEADRRALVTFRRLADRLDRQLDREPAAAVVALADTIAERVARAETGALPELGDDPRRDRAIEPEASTTEAEPSLAARGGGPSPVSGTDELDAKRPPARGRVPRWAAAAAAIAVAALGVAAAVRGIGGAADAPASAVSHADIGPPNSVAVLPFVNLAGDAATEYFGDGMTEELIHALAQVEGLRVVARTSAFKFKGKATDVREIGRALDVGAVVEGSVRAAGGRVVVTAQLIDAANGYHLWSGRFDRDVRDVFAVQDEIARAVTATLRRRLAVSPADSTSGATRATMPDPEAYTLYLKGRYVWNQRNAEAIRRAIGYFEESIRRDPAFARAHTGLADAYVVLPEWDSSVRAADVIAKARVAAERALALDPDLAEAHASMAVIHQLGWDWERAEASIREAISLNPNYATARHWYADLLHSLGRLAEAREQGERALALDPLGRIMNVHMGTQYLFEHRYAEAAEACRRALELDPNFAFAHSILARALEEQGRFDEAAVSYERAYAIARDTLNHLGRMARLHATAGRRAEAERLLAALDAPIRAGRADVLQPAAAAVRLGRPDQALAWLEQAYDRRGTELFTLAVDPAFDPIRTHPRYRRLLERMGIVRDGARAG